MKHYKNSFALGLIFLAVVILLAALGGCKKDDEPAFEMPDQTPPLEVWMRQEVDCGLDNYWQQIKFYSTSGGHIKHAEGGGLQTSHFDYEIEGDKITMHCQYSLGIQQGIPMSVDTVFHGTFLTFEDRFDFWFDEPFSGRSSESPFDTIHCNHALFVK